MFALVVPGYLLAVEGCLKIAARVIDAPEVAEGR
jgi:hypothetical protein